MKRRISLFLVFTLVIAMFYSDSVFAADNRVLKTIRYIEILEKELSNNGTSVELELDKALQYYQNLLLDRSSNLQDKNKILTQIEIIKKQKDNYISYKSGIVERGKKHPVYSAAISTICSYFLLKTYLLSFELLSHAADNNSLDSPYRPIQGTRVMHSPLFNKIKSSKSKRGTGEFLPDPKDPCLQDLHYAIKKFSWVKKSPHGIVTILDRYDFAVANYDGLTNAAVNLMYMAQVEGVIVPFKVIIER